MLRSSMTLLAFLLSAQAVQAGPSASFTPHRASTAPGDPSPYAQDPAPVYIHFDATSSDCDGDGRRVSPDDPQEFSDCVFEWDFGDPGSGTWRTSGRSKNAAYGAVAGHVYEAPGNYTVRLTVTDPSGATATLSKVVQVGDPDSVWISNTRCIGNSRPTPGAGGCPAGADTASGNDFDALLSSALAAGKKRILFKGGDTFSAGSTSGLTNGPTGYVGSFGSGRAIVNLGDGVEGLVFRAYNGSSLDSPDWRVVDLDIGGGTGHAGTHGVSTDDGGQADHDVDILILRVRIRETGGTNVDMALNGLPVPHDLIAIVDSDLEGGAQATQCFFGGASRYFFAGNTCQKGRATANSWMWRVQHHRKSIFQHNETLNVVGAYEAIKYHCIESLSGAAFNVISDNHFHAGTINFGRGSSTSKCTIQHTLWERNWFQDRGTAALKVGHPNNVIRHNIFARIEVPISKDLPPGGTDGNRVYSNVCYSPTSNGMTCVLLHPDQDPDNNTFSNMLAWYPNSSNPVLFVDNSGGSANTIHHSLLARTNPFVRSSFTSVSDFRINADSSDAAAILGHGSSTGTASVDLGLTLLLAQMTWDIGAFSTTSGGQTDTTPPAAPVLLGDP